MKTRTIIRRALFAALLLAPVATTASVQEPAVPAVAPTPTAAAAAPRSAPIPPSIFSSLTAGGTGRILFVVNPHPDGRRGTVKAGLSSKNEFERMEAEGSLVLETPEFRLEALNIVFDGAAKRVEARNNVRVNQEQISATADNVVYDVETRTLVMTGKPVVTQRSVTSSTVFQGMDEFRLVRKDNGEVDVQMTGAEEITAEIIQAQPTPTPIPPPDSPDSPTATPPAEGSDAAPLPDANQLASAEGLAGLGRSVRIFVAPRGRQTPVINTSIAGQELNSFSARGSIRLVTDSFNLRADQLEYNGRRKALEALYNVFLKQDGISADCGRIVFDIATGVITLNVNPIVHQVSATGATVISEIDAFILKRRPDGTYATDMIGGTNGEPRIEHLAADKTPAAVRPRDVSPAESVEIDDDGTGLDKIQ